MKLWSPFYAKKQLKTRVFPVRFLSIFTLQEQIKKVRARGFEPKSVD